MAKEKKEKVSKNPKHWDGAETQHSLKVGDKVAVEHFGTRQEGWEIMELQWHDTTGLACYSLKSKDGTKWPRVGKWMNTAIYTKIVSV